MGQISISYCSDDIRDLVGDNFDHDAYATAIKDIATHVLDGKYRSTKVPVSDILVAGNGRDGVAVSWQNPPDGLDNYSISSMGFTDWRDIEDEIKEAVEGISIYGGRFNLSSNKRMGQK
jgi:hypothetical protein